MTTEKDDDIYKARGIVSFVDNFNPLAARLMFASVWMRFQSSVHLSSNSGFLLERCPEVNGVRPLATTNQPDSEKFDDWKNWFESNKTLFEAVQSKPPKQWPKVQKQCGQD